MLPKYTVPQLTRDILTDDIIDAALENEGLLDMPVDIARDVCHYYMAHSAVLDEELEAFEAELYKGSWYRGNGVSGLEVIAFLSEEISSQLCSREELKYRENCLSHTNVAKAMEKVGIDLDADIMTSLLAILAVRGRQHLAEDCEDFLKENKITANDICRVADCFELEEV